MAAHPAPGDAPEFWGTRANEYDALIRRIVPRYDEMIDRLMETLPPSPSDVLELGSGTGNVAVRLLAALPDARLTLVDAAPEMLAVARARIAARDAHAADRTRVLAARFEELAVEPEAYDAIVACISVHHVTDPGPVYRTLRRSMRTGGALRMADGIAATTPALHALQMARWEAFWREPGNLDETEIETVRAHVEAHDHYFDLAAHFRMLRDAGFRDPDCTWRDGLFGVITAEAA